MGTPKRSDTDHIIRLFTLSDTNNAISVTKNYEIATALMKQQKLIGQRKPGKGKGSKREEKQRAASVAAAPRGAVPAGVVPADGVAADAAAGSSN